MFIAKANKRRLEIAPPEYAPKSFHPVSSVMSMTTYRILTFGLRRLRTCRRRIQRYSARAGLAQSRDLAPPSDTAAAPADPSQLHPKRTPRAPQSKDWCWSTARRETRSRVPQASAGTLSVNLCGRPDGRRRDWRPFRRRPAGPVARPTRPRRCRSRDRTPRRKFCGCVRVPEVNRSIRFPRTIRIADPSYRARHHAAPSQWTGRRQFALSTLQLIGIAEYVFAFREAYDFADE